MTSTGKRHVIFVIEGNSDVAEEIVDRLAALGFSHRLATTLEEARVEIDRGGFCLVLMNLRLKPHARSKVADIEVGFATLRLLRERFSERSADLKFVVQIIVMAKPAKAKEHARKAFQLDANDFMHLPFSDNEVSLEDAIRQCFRKAGRLDHATCLEGARESVSVRAGVSESVRAGAAVIVIDGSRSRTGTHVVINGVEREMQDSKFVVLLRFVVAHVKKVGSWSSREQLGVTRSRDTVSRVRAVFKGLVPKGFEPIERDRRRSFRLNPDVVVEPVDWEALAEHPNEQVRKIANGRVRARS